ncbi:hypothetical protein T492DRAFT_432753 [Pavlovales sp. CCMP2436]|nr:hypothetical protein T492DRAFT_432753 [Pavlovales sp. CCMP2436]
MSPSSTQMLAGAGVVAAIAALAAYVLGTGGVARKGKPGKGEAPGSAAGEVGEGAGAAEVESDGFVAQNAPAAAAVQIVAKPGSELGSGGCVRVCMVGTGAEASTAAMAVLASPRYSLSRVVDVSAEAAHAFATSHINRNPPGLVAAVSTDVGSACRAGDVDALIVCAPAAYRAAILRAAAEQGTPTLSPAQLDVVPLH